MHDGERPSKTTKVTESPVYMYYFDSVKTPNNLSSRTCNEKK